ncbi:MAG: homoserine dehydrogenase [Candidatus Margulisbacteria bacterium]|nr:homoserine dehydrogenase [Candidatus Margulisiibacteriota bacterium]MBU1616489.1 homoserine dehydrogenase [Candidatus Margulisiibacteriota bacterium]
MKQINIGIIGLGVVGSAVAEAIKLNSASIAARSGLQLKIKKGCDLRKVKAACPVTNDAYELINDPEVKVIVETMGGVNPAKKFVLDSLAAGKHVVTSNKELVALHMPELLSAARRRNVSILYEASVGGGIPILAALRKELAGNNLTGVFGIVNGTTNYILSTMAEEGKEFSEALKEAQEKGYAEANPKKDVEGYDAAYKAVILAAEAFGARVKMDSVYREGIEKIAGEDILYAREIGFAIKLLAIAQNSASGVDVRVHPALVPLSHPLAGVRKNFNAIYVQGFPVGELMFYGPGAGGAPTASAIVSDIIELGQASPVFRGEFKERPVKPIADISSRYYLRLQVSDKVGVLATIARVFTEKNVSIAAVIQKENVGNLATLVIMLDESVEKNIQAAISAIKKLSVVSRVNNLIRIL